MFAEFDSLEVCFGTQVIVTIWEQLKSSLVLDHTCTLTTHMLSYTAQLARSRQYTRPCQTESKCLHTWPWDERVSGVIFDQLNDFMQALHNIRDITPLCRVKQGSTPRLISELFDEWAGWSLSTFDWAVFLLVLIWTLLQFSIGCVNNFAVKKGLTTASKCVAATWVVWLKTKPTWLNPYATVDVKWLSSILPVCVDGMCFADFPRTWHRLIWKIHTNNQSQPNWSKCCYWSAKTVRKPWRLSLPCNGLLGSGLLFLDELDVSKGCHINCGSVHNW